MMLPVTAPRNLYGAIVVTVAVTIQVAILVTAIVASHGTGSGAGSDRAAGSPDATTAAGPPPKR